VDGRPHGGVTGEVDVHGRPDRQVGHGVVGDDPVVEAEALDLPTRPGEVSPTTSTPPRRARQKAVAIAVLDDALESRTASAPNTPSLPRKASRTNPVKKRGHSTIWASSWAGSYSGSSATRR